MYKNRISKIYNRLSNFKNNHQSLFLTSSFQTQSLVLLKIISEYYNSIPIYFINTSFHFPETIEYKNSLKSILNIQIIDISSDTILLNQFDSRNRLLYTSDTDRCCEINKTGPLKSIINIHDVWITGIRNDQTTYRKKSKKIEKIQGGKIKYNPLIEWTKNEVQDYIAFYKLPRHPLDSTDLMSIGCEPCTRLIKNKKREDGRWFGQTKTECGLHLNFKETL